MKSEQEMLTILAKYCSEGEKCIDDVRKKIRTEKLPEDTESRIIAYLIKEKFIDERRFSSSFVHDKFKFNHWGRIKIAYELKKRNIEPKIFQDALESIDHEEYTTVLTTLLENKKRTTKGRSAQDLFQKLYRFASSKGFESHLIVDTLKKIIKNIDYE